MYTLISSAGLRATAESSDAAVVAIARHLSTMSTESVSWRIQGPHGDTTGTFRRDDARGKSAAISDQMDHAHASLLRTAARAHMGATSTH